MGQSWVIANLDKREVVPCGRLKDGLNGYDGACTFMDCFRTWSVEVFECDLPPLCVQPIFCPIMDLPVEVIERIYDYLHDDILDVLALASTSSRLWNIGARTVQDVILAKFVRTWAGDRLICLGEYVSDYPRHALAKEERRELTAFEGQHSTRPPSLFRMAEQQFKEKNRLSMTLNWEWAGYTLSVSGRFSHGEWETIRGLISVDTPRREVMNMAPFVLCNLSKLEYVRADALQDMLEEMAQRNYMDPERAYHWRSATLSQVLMVCICWSDYADVPSPATFPVHRGIWAGDRFDITTMEALYNEDNVGDQEVWMDVSEEILEAFRHVWLRLS